MIANEVFTGLKAGDKVYTRSINAGYDFPFTEQVVESVTPTGRVTLVGGRKFGTNGLSLVTGTTQLYLRTPERVARMEERKIRFEARSIINNLDVKNLSTKKIVEIMAILNREDAE